MAKESDDFISYQTYIFLETADHAKKHLQRNTKKELINKIHFLDFHLESFLIDQLCKERVK